MQTATVVIAVASLTVLVCIFNSREINNTYIHINTCKLMARLSLSLSISYTCIYTDRSSYRHNRKYYFVGRQKREVNEEKNMSERDRKVKPCLSFI